MVNDDLMRCNLRYILLSLIVVVLLLIHPASVIGSYYVRQVEGGNMLFPPYIFMQYGPAPETSIPLYQTSAQFSQTNQTIFNSHVNIDSLEYAVNSTLMPITPASNLQLSFTSFFTYNKYEQQTIPQVSNISVELAPILNPLEVQWLTQIDTGQFVPLIMNESEHNYMPSFSIPTYLADGFYSIQLSAYFPDQAVNAVYTNTLCLGDCLNAVLASEGFNAPYDNTSEANDFLSGLNQTNM